MKSHEETWTRPAPDMTSAYSEEFYGTGARVATEPLLYLVGDSHADDADGLQRMEARARLAAQAPAMARLLLDLQYAISDDDPTCREFCPSCQNRTVGGEIPGQVGRWIVDHGKEHAPHCALIAVLRDAGVIE